jgi:hypothetical protein
MDQDGSEDDPDQGQTSPLVGSATGSIFGAPHEKREQEIKSPMNADFNPENASRRDGPTPHEKLVVVLCPAAISATSVILYS